MNQELSFGGIVKERRRLLDLIQAELARRVAAPSGIKPCPHSASLIALSATE